jgi:cobalt-zinc-cadmium efflux system outer membrane protein
MTFRRARAAVEDLMRMIHASMVLAMGLPSLAQATTPAEPITLADALRRAEVHPDVAISQADRDAAIGSADQAQLPLYNPELNLSAGPRLASGSRLLGVQIGIAQTIELGGKRDARRSAADARAHVAAAGVLATRISARIDAWRAYELAIVARMRRDAAKDAEALATSVVAATKEAAWKGTQLQLNLAEAELGRAVHDRFDTENGYAAAIAELAKTIGAPAMELVEPSATTPALPQPPAPDDIALRAIASHPDLVRARAAIDAAGADVRVADAAAVPDVTLSLSYAYEPDVDRRTQAIFLGAALPLPLRNRNQGQRASARALEHRAELESGWLRTEVERETRAGADRYTRARAAVESFNREVSERLHENLQLAEDSFRAGKIDFFAFTTARRDLFANRLAYLAAFDEAIEAWAVLARSAALEVQP